MRISKWDGWAAGLVLVAASVFGGEVKPLERLTEQLDTSAPVAPFENRTFVLKPNETVVFTGPENIVTEQRSGWIETALTVAAKDAKPRFRHMGWEGDTVYRQNRMENWGKWKENFDAVGATLIVAWFGQNEVLDATKTPADFEKAYAALIDSFKTRTGRIVIIAPPPFEKPADPRVPDNSVRNGVVKEHASIAKKIADERGLVFVDLFTALSKRPAGAALTRDGMHFTPDGLREVADLIATELKVPTASAANEPLRAEIIEKNRIWFDCWRCMNWAFAYGDRTTQPFAKATPQHPPFITELTRYRPLVARADERVHALALGQPVPPTLPLDAPPVAPVAQTPDEQMKNFTLYPGFSIGLFADESIGIIKPIQIRWDEKGRLWVLCVPSYPQLQPGQKANDFLLIVEDTNGDGKADKAEKYAENLVMPMGFEFGDGGVYICESTQLTHWRDTNGDGKADTQRVVLSGFGTGDTHQMINSLRWAPDGCLWFTQGYHIWSYVETPHGLSELSRSGLWRFNPRTQKLDGFFNESTAGLNSWGVVFDEYGQVFHGGGANYCLYYSTPGMIPTLHPEPYRQDFCVSRGKSMEPEFLYSKHLPDDMQGVLMKSTYFTSQVSLYRVTEDGAGYKSTAIPDLIASKSTDFRPVETRVGPDGAIYICDWLNPIIGHYQASYRDPRRDRSHGRIWRMTADGRAPVQRPALEKMNAVQLLEQLKSPERWVRDQARRLLYMLPKTDAVTAVSAWTAQLDPKTAEGAKLLYEATGVFAAHEAPNEKLVSDFLNSSDYHWRCWGTRLIGYWWRALPEHMAWLKKSATDEHPRVRMEAAIACSYIPTTESLAIATLLLDKPRDFYVNYALTQCIHYLSPVWEPALAENKLDLGGRTQALVHVLRTAGGPASLGKIRETITAGRATGENRDELLVLLVEAGSSDDMRFALEQGPGVARVHTALVNAASARKKAPSGDLSALLTPLFASADAGARAGAYRLVGAWKLAALKERAKTAAGDTKLEAMERSAAIEAYTVMDRAAATGSLQEWSKDGNADVRLAAVRALASVDANVAAVRGAELLNAVKTQDEAAPLLMVFLTLSTGPDALAKALTAKKPEAGAAAVALQWMAKAGYDDAALLAALNSAAGLETKREEYSSELVAKLVAAAKANGDAKRGEALFRKQEFACLSCHKVGTEGSGIGPELTSVARAMTPELIAEAVLWPKRQVKEGFLLSQVVTKDGRRFQGFKVSETDGVLTLRDVAGGADQVFSKGELRKRNDSGTLMPDGLTERMNAGEFSDLLRYLMELGK